MGLSASQGRMLLLTARKSDLEYRAQQISQKRLILSQQLEEISQEYEDATSNRQMKISLFLGGVNDSDKAVSRSSNLTYATLVSGTIAMFNSTQSGIAAYSRTELPEYSSTSAYRLVDADGAIVVSDEKEIPGSLITTSNSTEKALHVKDSKGNEIAGLRSSGQKNIDENKNETMTNESYYFLPKQDSALAAILNKDANKDAKVDIDTDKGIVHVFNKETNKDEYYNLSSGAILSEVPTEYKSSYTNVNLVKNENDIPPTSVTTASTANTKTVKGNDGKYTLYDAQGNQVARYVVDQSLKYGSTDVNGSDDGPNYLQDCLRNGKYLIEKGSKVEGEEKIKWNSLSWDATANISDGYYTEDDDKAKAKYDRLQGQIQAQDKKLELELDNIETQRSAVTTEEESVQKVIDDNIEGSFNAFA